MQLAEIVILEIERDRSFKVSSFLLKALVNRVNRRQCIRNV
jgi:hypothetical protein